MTGARVVGPAASTVLGAIVAWLVGAVGDGGAVARVAVARLQGHGRGFGRKCVVAWTGKRTVDDMRGQRHQCYIINGTTRSGFDSDLSAVLCSMHV